jgi:glutamate-ammonia-ligase adenylyltransferase
VEWTAQLLQLIHGHQQPKLQTTSTISALTHAKELALLEQEDADKLINAWIYASRVRSAITIWSDRSTDVVPSDVHDLEGIARLMGYPPGSASKLEEDYLSITRKARQVVERVFYDF